MAKKSIDPLPFDGPSLKHKHDLDQMKCPQENVELWMDKECKAFKRMEQKSCSPDRFSELAHLRGTLLRYMEATCQQVALQMSDWYTCVLYFDTLCATNDVQVDCLPAICVAIVAIVKKMDNSSLERWMQPGFKTYLASAVRIAAWLRDKGYDHVSEDVTEEQVGFQEKRVLKSLKWILHVPTIDTWLSAFWMRLHVFTNNHFDQQLQSMYCAQSQLSVQMALRWFTLGQAVTCDLPPRTIAAGVFCQGLVRVGLLPIEVLQGSGSSWQDLFNFPKFQPAKCDLREHDYRHMLGRLEAATGCDVATLRDDCESVASVFVGLSQKIHNPSTNPSTNDPQRVAQNPRGIVHHTSV